MSSFPCSSSSSPSSSPCTDKAPAKRVSKAAFFQNRLLDVVRPKSSYLGSEEVRVGAKGRRAVLIYACPAQVKEEGMRDRIPDFPHFHHEHTERLVTFSEEDEGVVAHTIATRWNVMAVDRDDPTIVLGAMFFDTRYVFRAGKGAFSVLTHILAAGVVHDLRRKGIGYAMADLAGNHLANQAFEFNATLAKTSLNGFGSISKAIILADFVSEGGERVCDAFVDSASILEVDGVEMTYDAGF